MASIQKIFFQPQRGFKSFQWDEDTNAKIADSGVLYELDGVIQERHRNVVSLTKQPIEFGAAITDHAIRQPIVINVQGIITNSPSLQQLGNNIPGVTAEGDLESPGFFSQGASSFTGERIQSAFAGIITLQNIMQPMTLQTGLINYENMVLTDVQVPNNKNNRLMLDMTFEEAIIIDPTGNRVSSSIVLASATDEVDYVTAGIALAGLGIGALSGLILN